MKRRDFVVSSALGTLGAGASQLTMSGMAPAIAGLASEPASPASAATRKILIAGGGFGTAFIRYMAELTGKKRPRICYLPTASADSPQGIISFYRNCAPLDVHPFDQESFIESLSQKQGWDEVLLSMDAIVVSGGNTLNQQAIWKAQGIDLVLRKAWARGVILGGASAGSLCWFEEGSTDSRPKELSIVKGLGFIKGSHAPHYDAEPGRRPQYQRLIASGQMMPGFACDNSAGIYFEGAKPVRFLSTVPSARVYSVAASGGKAVETVMPTELF